MEKERKEVEEEEKREKEKKAVEERERKEKEKKEKKKEKKRLAECVFLFFLKKHFCAWANNFLKNFRNLVPSCTRCQAAGRLCQRWVEGKGRKCVGCTWMHRTCSLEDVREVAVVPGSHQELVLRRGEWTPSECCSRTNFC